MVDSVVILAGGMGKRLWPLSTPQRPKYLLDPGIGHSLLRATLERAAQIAKHAIIIVTHCDHTTSILQELSGVPSTLQHRIVIMEEPQSKNTAPAIAWAVAYLRTQQNQFSTLCVPADHLISPLDRFKRVIVEVHTIIESHDCIVTIGVAPTRVECGYGYIERGAPIGNGYRVAAFHEKPNQDRAQHYFDSDRYYWNSGMFGFSNERMWSELETHAPQLIAHFNKVSHSLSQARERVREGIRIIASHPQLSHLYDQIPSISIDYAVAERSSHMSVVPASFDWNDVGSWDEVAALHLGQGLTHHRTTSSIEVNARNNLVIANQRVALCGVNDLLVVAHGDDLLICRRGESQLVKQVVERIELKSKNGTKINGGTEINGTERK